MDLEALKVLSFNSKDFIYISPEVFLLSSIIVILLLNLFLDDKFRQITYYLAQLSLVVSAVLSWNLLDYERVVIFSESFVLDYFSGILKIFIYVFSMVALVYSRHYMAVHKILKGEYFVLFLFAVFGMMVLASGYSLLTIYIGLEILTISFYTLIAFAINRMFSIEAALKYFVLAAIASGILLYGMSMVYGISGSINISEIASFTNNIDKLSSGELLVLNFGLVFIVIGLAFKFGAVPFHMWVPDVYHGAPTAVTMFLSTAPKIAILVMLVRLLVEALGGLVSYWQDILMFMAVASIVLGSLVALVQKNIKRLLAYSTISHIGFILLGFATGQETGYGASVFYMMAYILMSLVAFGVIITFNNKGFEADNISDYKGLAKTNPWFSLLMLITMLSMAGIPPFIGFYAKFIILSQIIALNYIWLAVVIVVFAVISSYYYLVVCKNIYFDTPEDSTNMQLTATIDVKLVLSINALLVVFIGIFPNYFINLINSIF